MAYEKIKTTEQGAVAVITLADPATLNAASLDLIGELQSAMDGYAQPDSGIRCVVITGEGRGFCSGANLSGRAENPGGPSDGVQARDAGAALETIYNPFVTRMRDYPLPIVTAVNGAAAGIGCSIALMGDLIVAGESGYFLQAFRRIGLVPDGGATYLLSRMVGKARTMELTLLGDKLPGKTALEWGLINRCVPDDKLMETALELAQALATGPKALGYIRKLVWDGLDAEWSEQLQAERIVQREAGRTEDSREGVLAFLQKRPAKFEWR